MGLNISDTTILILVCVFVIWVLVTAVWRLYLSPLARARIPGPKLAALTSWYEFYYDAIYPARYIWKIQELHKQYGSIVRITPREIHINDVEFLETIYAPATVRRDKDPAQIRTLRVPLALGGTTSYDLHRKRRQAMDPYFSRKNVVRLEHLIIEKIEKLCQLLDAHLASKEPLNLSDIYFALAHDVVSKFCYKTDNDVLSSERQAAILRSNGTSMLTGDKVNAHFPWLIDCMEALPSFIGKKLMPTGVRDLVEQTERTRKQILRVQQDLTQPSASQETSIFHELLVSKALPQAEKAISRLEQEGALLVMAGTDSVARSLWVTHYYILRNPSVLDKVRSELLTIPDKPTWQQLEKLTYLAACIAEGNRLSFGVTARLARLAPSPIVYLDSSRNKTYVIPSQTPMAMSILCTHTDERIFPDPFEFQPERWLGEEGRRLAKYQMAFNKGGRKCIGVELAHAELFLTLARVIKDYDVELYKTGDEEITVKHDYHVGMPDLSCKGIRVMVRDSYSLSKEPNTRVA